MATRNPNPSARAYEREDEREDIVAARKIAAAKLFALFGGKTADGKEVPGAFHTHGIKAIVSTDNNRRFVDELRSNPHARTLAIVSAARGLKNFPPALVAEFLARPELDESNDWLAQVFLGGLVQIFEATGVGLLPGSQAKLDLVRSAYNVVTHISNEKKKELSLYEADEAPPRRLATDLMAIAEEESAPLTPAQLLYRWALRKWDARQERREAKAITPSADDITGVLPQVKPPVPEPTPAPAGPAVPDLTILAGGEPTPPPAPPAISPPTPPAVAPAAEVTQPAPAAPAAVDEDKELVFAAAITAIEASNDSVAKAMVILLQAGKQTKKQAVAFALRKGYLKTEDFPGLQ